MKSEPTDYRVLEDAVNCFIEEATAFCITTKY